MVNFWLRNYDHPHQAKAVYFQAHFVHDCIRITKSFPPNAGQPGLPGRPGDRSAAGRTGWPRGACCRSCCGAIERLECARAVALTESYLGRTHQRKPLMRALALAASKFQNDPHIQRNGATSIEEWELTTAKGQRDNILRAWTKYVSGGVKRTTALDCVQQYEQIMGRGPGADRRGHARPAGTWSWA